jgi:hypothetical protein
MAKWLLAKAQALKVLIEMLSGNPDAPCDRPRRSQHWFSKTQPLLLFITAVPNTKLFARWGRGIVEHRRL